ncbi:hypothetical protein Nepgr_025287 [Nepenthes gracilis]|uniref:Uncharacterized protein n=1 Tax=Nepenthes gracilis TaxID=150966 RepID=A0AAD3Y0X2_NEPGR|nr:hypothetical protein Nepgr_025287 [Nepenthes gracilis]
MSLGALACGFLHGQNTARATNRVQHGSGAAWPRLNQLRAVLVQSKSDPFRDVPWGQGEGIKGQNNS